MRWSLFLMMLGLGACAKGDDATVCDPGEARCVRGAAQSCTVDGEWTVPSMCPADTVCVAGSCRRETLRISEDRDCGVGCAAVEDAGFRGGAGCADACVLGETRCLEGGVQTCALDVLGCADWSAHDACEPGTACESGRCVERCGDICQAGQRRCGAGGVQSCEIEAGCSWWSAPAPCPAGSTCAGAGECGACVVGDSERRACGLCGEQARSCIDAGGWTEWSACAEEGICRAGETEACGRCGARRCDDQCGWGACEEEGACTPGEERACGRCGRQRCTDGCDWGACEGGGPCEPGAQQMCGECGQQSCSDECQWEACNNGDGTLWRACNACGWQFCCPNGDWCLCDARFPDRCAAGQSCVGSDACQ